MKTRYKLDSKTLDKLKVSKKERKALDGLRLIQPLYLDRNYTNAFNTIVSHVVNKISSPHDVMKVIDSRRQGRRRKSAGNAKKVGPEGYRKKPESKGKYRSARRNGSDDEDKSKEEVTNSDQDSGKAEEKQKEEVMPSPEKFSNEEHMVAWFESKYDSDAQVSLHMRAYAEELGLDLHNRAKKPLTIAKKIFEEIE